MNDIHISNGYRLRPAMMDEIPVIWEIILQAKAQMYREGKHQWDENYPTVLILENDVRKGWGYVLVPSDDDSDIIAYGAVVFDGEPAYSGLQDGQWLSGQPYVVLHRLAVADRWKRQGMAVRYMQGASSPASASPTAAASATMPASAWLTKNGCKHGTTGLYQTAD